MKRRGFVYKDFGRCLICVKNPCQCEKTCRGCKKCVYETEIRTDQECDGTGKIKSPTST